MQLLQAVQVWRVKREAVRVSSPAWSVGSRHLARLVRSSVQLVILVCFRRWR